jgi:hypothetical protein
VAVDGLNTDKDVQAGLVRRYIDRRSYFHLPQPPPGLQWRLTSFGFTRKRLGPVLKSLLLAVPGQVDVVPIEHGLDVVC